MVWFRIWELIALAWSLDLALFVLFPFLRVVVDLLFLTLVFVGLRFSKPRTILGIAFGLGFLKDLVAVSVFGGFTLTYVVMALLLVMGKNFLEREDPLVAAVWTGLLAGFKELIFCLLLVLTDPFVRLTGVWFFLGLVSMVSHALLAFWLFPKLQRFVSRRPLWGQTPWGLTL